MDEQPSEQDYPMESSSGDCAHLLARAGISAIPALGGSALEFFNFYLAPPLGRRRDEWFVQLGRRISALSEKFDEFGAERLAENEAFVSSVMSATQIAMKSTQETKRAALLGAVLNSVSRTAPDEDQRHRFLQFIDELTSWHLLVLQVLADPPRFCRAHAVRYEPVTSSTRYDLLTRCFPELQERNEFLAQVMIDLKAKGLVRTADLMTMMSATGAFEKGTSQVGDEFLQFITEPPV